MSLEKLTAFQELLNRAKDQIAETLTKAAESAKDAEDSDDLSDLMSRFDNHEISRNELQTALARRKQAAKPGDTTAGLREAGVEGMDLKPRSHHEERYTGVIPQHFLPPEKDRKADNFDKAFQKYIDKNHKHYMPAWEKTHKDEKMKNFVKKLGEIRGNPDLKMEDLTPEDKALGENIASKSWDKFMNDPEKGLMAQKKAEFKKFYDHVQSGKKSPKQEEYRTIAALRNHINDSNPEFAKQITDKEHREAAEKIWKQFGHLPQKEKEIHDEMDKLEASGKAGTPEHTVLKDKLHSLFGEYKEAVKRNKELGDIHRDNLMNRNPTIKKYIDAKEGKKEEDDKLNHVSLAGVKSSERGPKKDAALKEAILEHQANPNNFDAKGNPKFVFTHPAFGGDHYKTFHDKKTDEKKYPNVSDMKYNHARIVNWALTGQLPPGQEKTPEWQKSGLGHKSSSAPVGEASADAQEAAKGITPESEVKSKTAQDTYKEHAANMGSVAATSKGSTPVGQSDRTEELRNQMRAHSKEQVAARAALAARIVAERSAAATSQEPGRTSNPVVEVKGGQEVKSPDTIGGHLETASLESEKLPGSPKVPKSKVA